jgi:HK97 family phage portal protein
MLNKFLNAFGYIKADKIPRWLSAESEAAQWNMPNITAYEAQANLYRTLSYIGTCVDIVTRALVDVPLEIDGADEGEKTEHPFLALLKKPNEYESQLEFLSAHFSWRQITGNSYWWLNKANENSEPEEMFIIPPYAITPVPDSRLGLRGYLYYPGTGEEIALEIWEIVHFKNYNPTNRWAGLSALESLAVTAEGAKAAQEWNTRLFAQNNARLPGILAFSDMINDNDWARLKREVTNAAGKRENMLLRGVGPGGVAWLQASATQREMEFIDGLAANEKEIYNRLAPGLYNMLNGDASLANGKIGYTTFGKFTVAPLLRETAEKINASIMPSYGDDRVCYNDITPEDKAEKIVEVVEFAKYHTVNEVRSMMFGSDPLEDERGALLVSQVTPVTAASKMPELEQEQDYEEDEAVKAELSRWKRKAIRTIGAGKACEFVTQAIPPESADAIRRALTACKSEDEVKAVFANALIRRGDPIRLLASAIERAVSAHE